MVTWSEALRTGVAEIDDQHQLLLRRAAVVREAGQAGQSIGDVKAAIDFLADYAAIHFETEARYMLVAAYPEAPAHLAEHAQLERELDAAAEAFAAEGASPALAKEVADLFEAWLVEHIQAHDRRLAGWLRRAETPRSS
jgi:hemerythrin